MKVALDCGKDGKYNGECECGFAWFGDAELTPDGYHSPALAVAEAVVHARLAHPEGWLDLKFSRRFEDWLEGYWMRHDTRVGLGAQTRTV